MKTRASDRRRVILYGDSVFMASVEASLRRWPELEVICIHAPGSDLEQQVSELAPDAIVVEPSIPLAQDMLIFVQTHPDLTLIGLDPNSRVAILLTSQQQVIQNVTGLVQLIKGKS